MLANSPSTPPDRAEATQPRSGSPSDRRLKGDHRCQRHDLDLVDRGSPRPPGAEIVGDPHLKLAVRSSEVLPRGTAAAKLLEHRQRVRLRGPGYARVSGDVSAPIAAIRRNWGPGAAWATVDHAARGRPRPLDRQGIGPGRRAQLARAIHARIAREWVMTVPSGNLSAGSFVSPVAFRSSSREPFLRNGIGWPWAAIT